MCRARYQRTHSRGPAYPLSFNDSQKPQALDPPRRRPAISPTNPPVVNSESDRRTCVCRIFLDDTMK